MNTASISGFRAQEAHVPYNTSKGAVMQLTRCMAADYGKEGIRVNMVCPGFIDTPINHQGALELGQTYAEFIEEALVQHSVKRLGTPTDIAEAVLFLASDVRSGFITGQEIVVDGGLTAKI